MTILLTPSLTSDDKNTDKQENPNLDVALRHAAVGLPVLPVKVFQDTKGRWKKKPEIRGWQERASTEPDVIRQWWSEFPHAIPGIELGRSGLLVIDADRHEAESDGVSAFAGLRSNNGDDLPHPQTYTAGAGEHHYYRQPAGQHLGNGEGNLPQGINVRGSGGFVVAPGSVRTDGAVWETVPAAPELTNAFREGSIPELPNWLIRILGPDHRPSSPLTGQQPTSSHQDREREYAIAALKACVAELEQTHPGSRNNRLNAIAYRLGRMVGREWLERHLIVSQLLAASETNRLVNDDGADSVRDTIESGLNAGIAHPHEDLSGRPDADTAGAAADQITSPPLIPVFWDGDAPINRTKWLVKDLVPLASSGLLVGESRAGKTFLAIDLARALSNGGLFVGKRARAGGTLYLAAEAPGTIRGRLQAARLGPREPFLDEGGRDKSTGRAPDLLCVATAPKLPDQLLSDKGRGQLVATALAVSEEMLAKFGLPLRLIVIDTMLATFDIQDWNNPAETRRVMNTLARISEHTGTVVLGIHLHGKDINRGRPALMPSRRRRISFCQFSPTQIPTE
jgi:Bifunctional DNA primase/polymerase, N-terminal/AAA domain